MASSAAEQEPVSAAPRQPTPPPPISPLVLTLRSYPFYVRELIAGGVAGATAKTSVAPLERCKILFQTGKLHSAGVVPTMQAIFRGEGFKGLFRGNGASVLRIIPYSSIHFGLYEHYRRIFVEFTYGPRDDHHGVSPLIDLFAGSAAGATAVLVTYPLDLVRTRLAYMTEAGSSNSSGNSHHSSSVQPSVNPVTSESTSLQQHRHHHQGRFIHVLRAADPHHSIRGVLMTTVQKEGLRGLYHGIGPSMCGILPYAGLKFFVYQHMKQGYLHLKGDIVTSSEAPNRLPVPAMLAFGGIAGLIAQTVTYPLDVVRRRMQVEGLKQREPPVALGAPHFPDERLPQSTNAALVAIARRQGWRVLYSGLSINYMKVIPSTAIGFTLYDYFKSVLDLPTHL